ncbi:hypothetical protein B0J13DRAFT_680883 [Dactylonectria estremocensis]|uniref:Uncharacterized protein n=1 Tax=Dactylonectria estremocensis TaxID=1079267 RepID=A0A9P9DFA1_9HYPO|nr:hypothetical protein B0J13DRAFT_680883 [Dactylonectria estremocensis]
MRTTQIKMICPLEHFLTFPVQDDTSASMDEDTSMDEDARTDEDTMMDYAIGGEIDGEYHNTRYNTQLPDDKAVQRILDALVDDSAVKTRVLKRLKIEDKALLSMLLYSLEDLGHDASSFMVVLKKADWGCVVTRMCEIHLVPVMESLGAAEDVLDRLFWTIRDTHGSLSALDEERSPTTLLYREQLQSIVGDPSTALIHSPYMPYPESVEFMADPAPRLSPLLDERRWLS